ncbi:tetraacyldisaccharide 4'-kinase [Brevundimonas sp. GN22]|uniref:tetraacyldisaccharide 4'-kinase n=1 Tax=Brevundimonas pishanensis TaxID=2896315 RepID=UPI001FA7D849|nr:tetraacyldisaccharide 4'-kinase [Brevundimonas pishanensis]
MKLNTPRWWYTRDRSHAPITRMALKPLSWVWAGVTARKIANTKGYAPGIPVISVGNLTVGGSGKTPITREILRLLREQGHAPSALSRGYGGKLEGPVVVDLDTHSAEDVGDEPLMLAQDGMVVISRDRVAGAKAAVAAGADYLVMDDGHQNPSLIKDISLIVVDGETRNDEWPFGDGSVFPSGPMREPIAAGLARADAVIVLLPTDLDKADPELIAVFGDLPVFTARLAAISAPPAGPQVGFAGIAKPWKVERSLIAAGCDLKDFVPLPDHAILTKDQFNFLKERAKVFDAGLVTTEKDWVRLSPEKRESIQAWPLNARFDDPAGFTKWLVADNVIAPT